MTYSVAVAGASGYAGGEVVRLLAAHPDFEVTTLTAHSSVGESAALHLPHIPQMADKVFKETNAQTLNGHDVIFLALPHGASGELAEHLDPNAVVIDLGADHRLESQHAWDDFYGGDFHTPWTYGMPELIRKDGTSQRELLKGAQRIAGPGCNVTAVTLALQPGLAAGLVEPSDIVATLVVGYSGAGKSLSKPSLLAAEAFGSAQAYNVGGVHRHIPEIRQNLDHAAGTNPEDISVSFTPVLAPLSRGIFATVSAKITDEALAMTDTEIRQVWSAAYGAEEFMMMLPVGQIPATGNVVGSNAAHLQVVVDRRAGRLIALSAIDNLVRGTAGQAIQALNIALGIKESQGLSTIGVAP